MSKQPTLSKAAIDAIAAIRENDKKGHEPIFILFNGDAENWDSGDVCNHCLGKALGEAADFYKELDSACKN